jgi:hypothetical protein
MDGTPDLAGCPLGKMESWHPFASIQIQVIHPIGAHWTLGSAQLLLLDPGESLTHWS